MKKEYLGINPIKVEGSRYEVEFGYSKFVNLRINNISYIPVLSAAVNMWGINWKDKIKEKAYAKVQEEKRFLSFYAKTSDVKCPQWIAGYPSIRFGQSPWSPHSGFEIGMLKNYRKMNVSTKWEYKTNKECYSNFTYDIWLTKNKKGDLTNKDIEIMVWLDNNFKRLPDWDNMDKFGDFVIVKHKKKNLEWNNGGHVFAFFLEKGKTQFKFDLKDIANHCKFLIKDIDDYYIRTIELGSEFGQNAKVKAKLFKMDMEFEK
ncbi:MAG: GH12 family glycosyl hydrolase domain-containing protein [Candidatus Nanoarchaeia archaeon]